MKSYTLIIALLAGLATVFAFTRRAPDNPPPINTGLPSWSEMRGMNIENDPVLTAKPGTRPDPEDSYINNCIKIAKLLRMNAFRITFKLDAYYGNEANFIAQAVLLSRRCNENNIAVNFDNHHFYTAKFGSVGGSGFPSLWTNGYNPTSNFDSEVRAFWRDFFRNTLRNFNNPHRELGLIMAKLMTATKDFPNVYSFEIINEPYSWAEDDYIQMGIMHTTVSQVIRANTPPECDRMKIVFCEDNGRGGFTSKYGLRHEAVPLDPIKNVAYDFHRYKLVDWDKDMTAQMSVVGKSGTKLGKPIAFYLGECATQSDQYPDIATMEESQAQALMDKLASGAKAWKLPNFYWAISAGGEGNALRTVISGIWELSKYGKRYLSALNRGLW
jgi:hypothetical protein